MSDSASPTASAPSTGRLSVDAPHWAAPLTLFDSTLQQIDSGLAHLERDLVPGLYKIQTRLGSAVADQLAEVRAGQTSYVNRSDWDVQFSSPMPLVQTSTRHEYYTYSAVDLSRRVHWTHPDGGQSELFLFVRLLDRDLATRYPRFAEGLRILDGEGKELTDVQAVGERNPGDGWFGCTLRLPPGPYQIAAGGPGRPLRFQPLWTTPGFQTQVFIPAAERPNLASMALLTAPLGRGFVPDDDVAAAAQLILDGLQRGQNLASSDQIRDLVMGKLENPWLAILAGHALQLDPSPDPSFQVLIQQFLDSVMPDHPDWRALKLAQGLPVPEPFRYPPLLWRGLRTVLAYAAAHAQTVPADSPTARVSTSLLADSAWSAWRNPTLAVEPAPAPAPAVESLLYTLSAPDRPPESRSIGDAPRRVRLRQLSKPAVLSYAESLRFDDQAPITASTEEFSAASILGSAESGAVSRAVGLPRSEVAQSLSQLQTAPEKLIQPADLSGVDRAVVAGALGTSGPSTPASDDDRLVTMLRLAADALAVPDGKGRTEAPDASHRAGLAARLRAVTDRLADRLDALVITDYYGRVIDANPAFERMVGYDLADLLPSGPADTSSIVAPIEQSTIGRADLVLKRADGTDLPADLLRVPIEDYSSSQRVGYVNKLRPRDQPPLDDATRDAIETARSNLTLFISLLEHGTPTRRSEYLASIGSEIAGLERLLDTTATART